MVDRKRFKLSHIVDAQNHEVRLPGGFEKHVNHSISARADVECGQIDGNPTAFYTNAGISVDVEETSKGTQIDITTSKSDGADGPSKHNERSVTVDLKDNLLGQTAGNPGVDINFSGDQKTAKMADSIKGVCNESSGLIKSGFKPFKLLTP